MYKKRKIHKSREVKNINLSLTELKYALADHGGMTKSDKKVNFKIPSMVRSKPRRSTTKDVLRTCHLLILKGGERCKHPAFAKELRGKLRASIFEGFGEQSKTEERDFRCFARAKNEATAKKRKRWVREGKEGTACRHTNGFQKWTIYQDIFIYIKCYTVYLCQD